MKVLCDYGCGKEAKHQFQNGKWCCSESYNQCLGKIIVPWNKGLTNCYTKETLEKMKGSRSHKGKTWEDLQGKEKADKRKKEQAIRILKNFENIDPWNKNKKGCFNKQTLNQMSESHKKIWTLDKKEYYSKKFTMKLRDYLEKYPFFCTIEELRENDKQEVEVKCKYCNKWFVPTPMQIKERLRAIESKNGSMKTYMYCCKKHQYLCSCSIVKDPKSKTEYENYVSQVWVITNQNIKQHKIKNLELRGIKEGYHLDHKYSIREGFYNKVEPDIIGHYKNLEILKDKLNISKNYKCSISLEKLKKEIKEVKYA